MPVYESRHFARNYIYTCIHTCILTCNTWSGFSVVCFAAEWDRLVVLQAEHLSGLGRNKKQEELEKEN